MSYEPLNSINFQGGIDASSPPLSPQSQSALSEDSWNAIVTGLGFTRGFGGGTSMGANTGSRKMLPFGKTWGGIKDVGAVKGSGSFFEDIGRSRWGIGAGQPHIEGANVSGFALSTILQVSVASSGVFAAPVQAGLGQPSAPEIGIIAASGDISNPVSVKIERRRLSTGARSLASPTSAVVVPSGNRVRVTLPLAVTGQTHWRVYFTFQGFGGTGVHYLAVYGTEKEIPESAVASGAVGGIARSLEFNYKDGDLLPLEASYDDYTPPAATHAIRLGQVLNLAGCYSDTSTPTSTNTGTAIAVSKINNYESYVPTHLLFLPEQVTDVLARPIDDYGYIACENSVHAIQFVGYRGDELPPCTITTVLPDIGVLYPHNWTTFRGQLLIYTAEGNLLLMQEGGGFDTTFAGPITKIIKNWNPLNTIVGYDPKNDLLIVANGKRILVYSLAAQVWRQIWLPDFGITGTVLACTTSKRRLFISIDNGASVVAYSFDTANRTAPLFFVCNYQNQPSGNAYVKDLSELAISAESSASNASLAVCIGKNLRRTVFRSVSVTSGSGQITDGENGFGANLVNKKVVIFGENIGGGGVNFVRGRVSSFLSAGTLTLTKMDGTAFASLVNAADLLMFVGDFVAVKSFGAAGRHFPNFFPNLPECRSYQVAVWLEGRDSVGNVLSCDVFGTQYASSRARQ